MATGSSQHPGAAPVAMTTQQQPSPAFQLTVVGQGRGGCQYSGHKQHLKQAWIPHLERRLLRAINQHTFIPSSNRCVTDYRHGFHSRVCVFSSRWHYLNFFSLKCFAYCSWTRSIIISFCRDVWFYYNTQRGPLYLLFLASPSATSAR